MTSSSDLTSSILAMCKSTAAHAGKIRVGVDVVSVRWFARQLAPGENSPFLRTAFTTAERTYCSGRPERFAARWAAKEAVAKAIGTGFRGLRPGEIEIVHLPDGRPAVMALPGTAWPHRAHVWEWALTLCHEADAALAVAIGVAPDENLSPYGNLRD